MRVEALGERTLAILLLSPAGHRDDIGSFAGWLCPQGPTGLVPVHFRHGDIKQDHVGPEIRGTSQRVAPVVGRGGFTTECSHERGDAVRRVYVVVHDQDAPIETRACAGTIAFGWHAHRVQREDGSPSRERGAVPRGGAVCIDPGA